MVSTRKSKMINKIQQPRPKYQHITRNIYKCSMKRKFNINFDDACECDNPLNGCDKFCLNRLCYIECGKNCSLGPTCGNRCLQHGSYAYCKIFLTNRKGYGLKIQESIESDKLIIEMIGEIIDYKRFVAAKEDLSYAVQLGSNAILSSAKKGNLARFINHSCRPNARMEKWIIDGEIRIGVFSNRSIAANEEITIDYNWGKVGKNQKEPCYCESPECRGFIIRT